MAAFREGWSGVEMAGNFPPGILLQPKLRQLREGELGGPERVQPGYTDTGGASGLRGGNGNGDLWDAQLRGGCRACAELSPVSGADPKPRGDPALPAAGIARARGSSGEAGAGRGGQDGRGGGGRGWDRLGAELGKKGRGSGSVR